MMYYTREITMPKDKQEGLANFVQMIINELEADNTREALLKAVDLHGDIVSGCYEVKDTQPEPIKMCYDPSVNKR
jgi:hypothetical protein